MGTYNKIIINDEVILDLSSDTITINNLLEGVTAHDATGMQITGKIKKYNKEYAGDLEILEPVAYSYNRTVLPALPEWDEEAYPYAFISNEIFDSVIFHALAYEPYNNGIAPSEGTICNPYDESIPLVQSFLNEDSNSWDELTTGNLGPSGQISEPFWSNFNVKYENGSVQLYASDPIPVYE